MFTPARERVCPSLFPASAAGWFDSPVRLPLGKGLLLASGQKATPVWGSGTWAGVHWVQVGTPAGHHR